MVEEVVAKEMNPAPPNWFYVYMLKSKLKNSTYIGCTSNLHNRLEEHKKSTVYTTRKMLPIELIYYEAYRSKKDAYERERRLKHHSSALRNLKIRIRNSILEGGAG